MSIVEIRKQVITAYAGKYKNTPWEKKVMKMADSQVMSIYFRLKGEGKL